MKLYLQDPIRADWGRHTLLLCHVDGPDQAPHMVVIKAAVEANGAIFNEWAVLEWLNGIERIAPLVPALFGGDTDEQLIVIEDLGAGPTLHRALQADQDWAVQALEESQRLLGTIHSATRGRESELRKVRALLPPGSPPQTVEVSRESLQTEIEEWSKPGSIVSDEIELVATTLDVPPTFQTLTFNDACAPNRIVTAEGVRALDFEMAGFRHPMTDGAYASIGHLRCVARRLRRNDGLVIPTHFRGLATEAYRSAVLAGYPEYRDTARFKDDLTAAAAVWMMDILKKSRLRVAGDKPSGFFGVTACQRVFATLQAFSQVASSNCRLPGLAEWADALRKRLTSEWPVFPALAEVTGLGLQQNEPLTERKP